MRSFSDTDEVAAWWRRGLISIHQVLFKPLVEMMITELSTPLASNKCRPLPVVGERLWMTDFSSGPLLEAKAVIFFLLWNDAD